MRHIALDRWRRWPRSQWVHYCDPDCFVVTRMGKVDGVRRDGGGECHIPWEKTGRRPSGDPGNVWRDFEGQCLAHVPWYMQYHRSQKDKQAAEPVEEQGEEALQNVWEKEWEEEIEVTLISHLLGMRIYTRPHHEKTRHHTRSCIFFVHGCIVFVHDFL